MNRKGHKVIHQEINQFMRLYQTGHTLTEISKETGWSKECVRKNLLAEGINMYSQGKRREKK